MKNIIIYFIKLLISCLYLILILILINKVSWFKNFINFFIHLFGFPYIGVCIIAGITGLLLGIILKFIDEKFK